MSASPLLPRRNHARIPRGRNRAPRPGASGCRAGARLTEVEARRPDLRFALPAGFATRLRGQTVLSLGRRAKYLLADLSSDEVLIMHLGMTGRFLITAPDGQVRQPGEFEHEAGGSSVTIMSSSTSQTASRYL